MDPLLKSTVKICISDGCCENQHTNTVWIKDKGKIRKVKKSKVKYEIVSWSDVVYILLPRMGGPAALYRDA
jgi:hypothetical protein